jgi:hypothetical protein
MNSTTSFLGGNLSVRKPEDRKSIIGFGQDEAVMKQHCFATEAWTAPSGHQKAIAPKDEGMGVMISHWHQENLVWIQAESRTASKG